MPIQSLEEARSVARLLEEGKIGNREAALADLRAFDQTQQKPAAPAHKYAPYEMSPEMIQGQVDGTIGVAGALVHAPTSFVQGAGQAAIRVGKALGIVSPEYAQRYESAVADENKQFASTNNLSRAGIDANDISGMAAGMIPVGGTALSAEKAAGKMSGYLWQLLKGGAAGGTVAATHVTEEDQSKLGEVAVGAAFPMAVQALAGAGTAAKNVITQAIRKADELAAPRVQAALKEARQFWQGSAIKPEPYTAAMQSGNPVLQRLEFQAKGPLMNEMLARSLDKTSQRFDELARAAQGSASGEAGAIAGGANKTVDILHKEMQGVATTAYKKGLDEVDAMAAGSGARVRMDNLQNAYADILAEKDNPFTLGGSHVPKDVRAAFDLVSKMNRMDMGADASTVAKILKGISANVTRGETVLTPAEQAMNRYAATLRAAVEKDLDAALSARQAIVPAGTKNATRDPFEHLDTVRKDYAGRKAAITRLEDDRLSKIFGSQEALATPRQALNSFYKLEPEDMKFAVGVLDTRAPEVLQGMRGDRLRQILQQSNVPGAANQSTFDANKFRQLMYDGKDGVVNTSLWDDATRKRLLEGASHLQIMQNTMSGMGGTPFAPADVLMNAVGLNPIFTTRMVTRLAYGKYGDQLLGTPEGLAALRALSSTGKTGAQAKAQAAAWVLSHIEDEEEQASGK